MQYEQICDFPLIRYPRYLWINRDWLWHFGAEIPLNPCLNRKPPLHGFKGEWEKGYITHVGIDFDDKIINTVVILLLRVTIRPFVAIYQTIKWYLIIKPKCRREYIANH
jgi:hypothetical protein